MFVYEKTNKELMVIHLHGFASNVRSQKVSILTELAKKGMFSFFAIDMEYQRYNTSRSMSVLNILVDSFCQIYKKILISGSSHGAYVSLNYLKFYNPQCIERALLFAPSYSSLKLILEEAKNIDYKPWLEGKDELIFTECGSRRLIVMNREFAVDIIQNGYEIIEDGKVNFPEEPPVSLFIAHGTKDDVVSVEQSRLFTSKVKVERYKEVEDDHRLTNTFRALFEEFLS